MKGKVIKRKKIVSYLLLAVSFILTIVLTATITLAWFYDTDWANKTVKMAGSVGIQLRDYSNKATSGDKQLHFVLSPGTSDLAYPGQAILTSASVFNDGGSSIINYFKDTNNIPATPGGTYGEGGEYNPSDTEIKDAGELLVGSACYIRAHFAVYTNIGTKDDDPSTPDINEADPDTDKLFNAQGLYEFLIGLIEAQNQVEDTTYRWVYYRNPNAIKKLEGTYYLNGDTVPEKDGGGAPDAQPDDGYFYLCYTDGYRLKPLPVGETAAFLWNGSFVIPWQLTNASADRNIFVGVSFQAIQTYIPQISNDGVISKNAINQLDADLCYYYDSSVQTIFNSCNFKPINTTIDNINYSSTADGYVKAWLPTNPSTGTIKGETAPAS